jgi:MoaA/NifB/PqqE/SkfB family radical SAM enzyme
MCDHYNICKRNVRELSFHEINYIVDCIKEIGTNSIVISGGEPLARSDFFDIIEYIYENELHSGLLTNGIKDENGICRPITKNEARKIAEYISWIQLSIDSFKKDTYKTIRGKDYLDLVLQTLVQLTIVNYKNIEITYIIQKSNIDEIITCREDFEERLSDVIDIYFKNEVKEILLKQLFKIPIRFKFAHGPVDGISYLCEEENLKTLLSSFPNNSNFDYINLMIEEGFFNIKDIANGKPLANRMNFLEKNNKCFAMRFSCKIDSYGDIYPCCFLFDDNNSNSDFRSKYKIGSMRSDKTNVAHGPKNNLRLALSSKEYRELIDKRLPIDPEACTYCTRHFYQNEFLNNIFEIYDKNKEYKLVEDIIENNKYLFNEKIWL